MRFVWPLLMEANEAQLMPVWKLSFNSTSRIFASRITWRSTDSCVAFRYRSTARNSSGMPRTTTTPDCGLITTLRPSAVPPMMAPSDSFSSAQKLLSDVVLRLELSCTTCSPGWPGCCWFCCDCCPLLPPLWPLLLMPAFDTDVEDTRKFDVPLRLPVR